MPLKAVLVVEFVSKPFDDVEQQAPRSSDISDLSLLVVLSPRKRFGLLTGGESSENSLTFINLSICYL